MESKELSQSQSTPNKIQLPNSTGVLVMGILSIVCFCCIPLGVISLVLGIISLILGNKALNLYTQNPELYTYDSYKNTKGGRVCGIIGLSLGGLWFLGLMLKISFITMILATIFSSIPWGNF